MPVPRWTKPPPTGKILTAEIAPGRAVQKVVEPWGGDDGACDHGEDRVDGKRLADGLGRGAGAAEGLPGGGLNIAHEALDRQSRPVIARNPRWSGWGARARVRC